MARRWIFKAWFGRRAGREGGATNPGRVLLADAALGEGFGDVSAELHHGGGRVARTALPDHPPSPAASTFLRQVAWAAALQQTSGESLLPLFPRLGAAADAASRQGAATVLDRCKDELATGLIGFDEVLEKAATHNGLGMLHGEPLASRGVQLHAAYLDILRNMGLCDHQQARSDDAIEIVHASSRLGRSCWPGWRNSVNKPGRCSNSVGDQVEAAYLRRRRNLPMDLTASGCALRPSYWSGRHTSIFRRRSCAWQAQPISEQAEAVFAEVAELGPAVRTDEITIGLADESIVPHIETTAANLTNVPVRYGRGTFCCRVRALPELLNVIADLFADRRIPAQFSILIRHPGC